ncbi:MAG: type II/IV secretion system protein [Gammaproteobacteria bacterium]|nr:MAG: type II/IV secretion system protein [Gammaproteobacteria bacterium]
MTTPDRKETAPSTAKDILTRLYQQKRIDADAFKLALLKVRSATRKGLTPIEQVACCGLTDLRTKQVLDAQQITEWLGREVGMDVVVIDPLKVDVDRVTAVMSRAFAERHHILAIEHNAVGVVIAASHPDTSAWLPGLEHTLRKPIRVVLANPADIRRYQKEFYGISRSVRGAEGEKRKQFAVDNFEQLVELGRSGELDANDSHVVSIVDWLLQYAFDQRASDIHIEPRRDVGKVRFRIDGLLHNIYELPGTVTSAVISRLKILGRMDVAERRRPLDGRIKSKLADGKEIELRLSTLPTAFGEKLVARIFDPDVVLRSYTELGFSIEDERTWRQMVQRPHGIVLVTGPTGSGKTTTLYTTLKHLAVPTVNVCTIEDPIEMIEPRFNQVQVQHETGVTFASGIRALLRQDPDIIMVGEIRDPETLEMAAQAALTGHLVLSTLHTNDAPSAITRLLDLGLEPFLLNATVIGVMAQRLVRVLCPHCKEARPCDEKDWLPFVKTEVPKPEMMFQAVGCRHCRQTGYLGRQGIYEMMTISETIRTHVVHSPDLKKIRAIAEQEGMRTLLTSGALKVADGTTTATEVLRVCSL